MTARDSTSGRFVREYCFFELVTDEDGVEPRIRDCDHYSIKERLED